MTELTYLGTVHGTLAALRRMRPLDRGTIVQVGSALAHRAIPLQAAYCASKHAVEGFNEWLRWKLLRETSGVRLTLVQLPALNTSHFGVVRTRLPPPMPVPPIYQPELVAEATVWPQRIPRRELNVGCSTTAALGGNKLAPGLHRSLPRAHGLRRPADRCVGRRRSARRPGRPAARRPRHPRDL